MKAGDIAQIQMTTGNWSKVRGYATVTMTNGMVVRGIKIIEGAKGLFVGMPSRQTKKEGKDAWEDCVGFTEKDDLGVFQKALLDKYNELANSGERSTPKKAPAGAPTAPFDDGLDGFLG